MIKMRRFLVALLVAGMVGIVDYHVSLLMQMRLLNPSNHHFLARILLIVMIFSFLMVTNDQMQTN